MIHADLTGNVLFADGLPPLVLDLSPLWRPAVAAAAIVVADAERSVAFYRERLGFALAARQTNTGPEQDRLDGLQHVSVDVIALEPAQATPHLELLAYRHPPVVPAGRLRPSDVAATRLVLEVDGLDRPALLEDPDGHKLLLLPQSGHLVSLPD